MGMALAYSINHGPIVLTMRQPSSLGDILVLGAPLRLIVDHTLHLGGQSYRIGGCR